MEFLSNLFESSRFTPRGETGGWTPALAWLHITCDLLIWVAFMAIAVMLVYLARRRRDLPFIWIIVMFGAFIIACGFTHFMEVVTFSAPMYRLSGLLKVVTALLSCATVVALIPLLPKALTLRSPHELEREIAERKRVEHELLRHTDSLKEQAQLLDLAHETIVVRDMTGAITYWNHGAEEMYGWKRSQALGHDKHKLLQTAFPRPYRELERELIRDGYCEVELEQARADGRPITVASRWALQRTEYGDPKGILEISRDITEQKRAEQCLRAEAERMEQVAQFGKRALAGVDFDAILHDATNLTARNLHVEYVGVFEILDGQDQLLLRAGAGWHDDARHAFVPAGNGSLPGHAMEARGSVVTADVESDPRFRVTQLELDHHIVSAITAVIYCGQRPMGALVAETTKRRVFNWKEVHFLEAIGNILGLAAGSGRSKLDFPSAHEPGNGKSSQHVSPGRFA